MQTNHEVKIEPTPLYFVYDRECPICKIAAELYYLRQSIGSIEVIDARNSQTHPVIKEINIAGLDLDQGMVIKYAGDLYHDGKASRLMAQLSGPKGWLNWFNKTLAISDHISMLSYPVVKAMRNALIALLGVEKLEV